MEDMLFYSPIIAAKLRTLTHQFVSYRIKQAGVDCKHGMFILLIRDNPALTQNQICEKLGFDKAHGSRVLNDLLNKGLVKNIPDEKDNRKHCYVLTDKGVKTATLLEQILNEWRDILKQNIDAKDLEACRNCIKLVMSNASQKVKEVKTECSN